jgi:hypothetical protein
VNSPASCAIRYGYSSTVVEFNSIISNSSGLRMSFEGFMFGVIGVMVILYAMAWINGDVQNQLPQKRIETFFIFLGVAVFVGLIASIP